MLVFIGEHLREVHNHGNFFCVSSTKKHCFGRCVVKWQGNVVLVAATFIATSRVYTLVACFEKHNRPQIASLGLVLPTVFSIRSFVFPVFWGYRMGYVTNH